MDKKYKGLSFMQGKLYVPSSTREVYGRLIRLDEEVTFLNSSVVLYEEPQSKYGT